MARGGGVIKPVNNSNSVQTVQNLYVNGTISSTGPINCLSSISATGSINCVGNINTNGSISATGSINCVGTISGNKITGSMTPTLISLWSPSGTPFNITNNNIGLAWLSQAFNGPSNYTDNSGDMPAWNYCRFIISAAGVNGVTYGSCTVQLYGNDSAGVPGTPQTLGSSWVLACNDPNRGPSTTISPWLPILNRSFNTYHYIQFISGTSCNVYYIYIQFKP